MSQIKKSPTRKTRAEINAESWELKRSKKRRGNPPGSRHNVSATSAKTSLVAAKKDLRLGSKTPIALIIDEKDKSIKQVKSQQVKQVLTPEQELQQLESDERLDQLLINLEQGKTLSVEEQHYVDTMLDRIDELMTILGIELEDESEDDFDLTPKNDDIIKLLKG